MLRIITSMSQLDTQKLMEVYRESNLENGSAFFPDLSAEEQLLRAEDGFLTYLREDFFRQKGAFYCVWALEGAYESALRLEPYRDGLLIEALETRQDARRRGYAYALLLSVLDYLRTTNCKKVYSHVSKRNSASLGVHHKCGFLKISDSAVYIDGTVTHNSATMCYNL